MNAYKNDLVRYFLQQGYRREDVEAALNECNYNLDRSGALLRMRYRSGPVGTGVVRHPGSHGVVRRTVPPSSVISVGASGPFGHFSGSQPSNSGGVSGFGRGVSVS